MITKLYPDGKSFVGEAKILSTPMGQVKVIRNTNNEPGKMNKEITNKEGYVR